jgi:predicted nucleic acid-binding Zn ribbon protein
MSSLVSNFMGKQCIRCGKLVKKPELTHCSDECLMADIKKSESLRKDDKDAVKFDEKTNPWK